MMNFGDLVHTARKRLGISQATLQERCGYLDEREIYRIERKTTNVTLDRMLRIAEGLGCDLIIEFKPKSTQDVRDLHSTKAATATNRYRISRDARSVEVVLGKG